MTRGLAFRRRFLLGGLRFIRPLRIRPTTGGLDGNPHRVGDRQLTLPPEQSARRPWSAESRGAEYPLRLRHYDRAVEVSQAGPASQGLRRADLVADPVGDHHPLRYSHAARDGPSCTTEVRRRGGGGDVEVALETSRGILLLRVRTAFMRGRGLGVGRPVNSFRDDARLFFG